MKPRPPRPPQPVSVWTDFFAYVVAEHIRLGIPFPKPPEEEYDRFTDETKSTPATTQEIKPLERSTK